MCLHQRTSYYTSPHSLIHRARAERGRGPVDIDRHIPPICHTLAKHTHGRANPRMRVRSLHSAAARSIAAGALALVHAIYTLLRGSEQRPGYKGGFLEP